MKQEKVEPSGTTPNVSTRDNLATLCIPVVAESKLKRLMLWMLCLGFSESLNSESPC